MTWKKKKQSIPIIPPQTYKSLEIYGGATVSDLTIKESCYFIGRWFPRIVNGNLFAMTAIAGGGEVRVNVESTTTVKARFFIDPNTTYIPFVAFSVDDVPFTRQAIAPDGSTGVVEVTLATNLSIAKHKVRLILSGVKEDSPRWSMGVGLHFLGFFTDTSGLVTPYPSRKKIMFVGDSITEGVLILGTNLPSGNAAEQCYTHVSSNILGADPIITAFGGVGVTKGGAGGVPQSQDNFSYYKNTLPTDTENPSLVVINLATNDNSALDANVKSGYQALINVVRGKHQNVKIVCLRPFGGYKASVIQQIVAENANLYYIDTTSWNIESYGGLHPNATGHKVAGENLASAITATFGSNLFS